MWVTSIAGPSTCTSKYPRGLSTARCAVSPLGNDVAAWRREAQSSGLCAEQKTVHGQTPSTSLGVELQASDPTCSNPAELCRLQVFT